ncbi:hypothetical protein [Azohydromonas sediminis]|uniref:hypothetical protein n=1 Tax=Azohydromonas sediminis TaxID=2259674 RepID=UPI0013C2EBC2|nr:hypothetical protein [Azohydromonas sediminis]
MDRTLHLQMVVPCSASVMPMAQSAHGLTTLMPRPPSWASVSLSPLTIAAMPRK